MGEEDKEKLNINANPAGTLEIEEFKIRMAERFRKLRRQKETLRKK